MAPTSGPTTPLSPIDLRKKGGILRKKCVHTPWESPDISWIPSAKGQSELPINPILSAKPAGKGNLSAVIRKDEKVLPAAPAWQGSKQLRKNANDTKNATQTLSEFRKSLVRKKMNREGNSRETVSHPKDQQSAEMLAGYSRMSLKKPQSSPTVATRQSSLIVYFDGACGFCNATVNFLMRCDPQGKLKFAPLQGVTASQRLTAKDREHLNTIVVSQGEQNFRRSAAVIRILWKLGGAWSLLGTLLWLVPLPVRDLGYRIFAHNRYRFLGKHESCRLPLPEERDRILE